MAQRAFTILGLAFALAVPALAAPANPLAEFQRREGQLFDAGWNMARANAPFCAKTVSSVGLLIHDANNYSEADQVRAALSLAGDIGVQAVAQGSPAAAAGIVPNRTIFAIDAANVEQTWKPTRPTVQRTLQIEAAIATSLEDGRIDLSLNDRGGDVPLTGEKVCAAKFRLTPGDTAYAGPDTVFFGNAFPAYGMEKDVFAAALAHELAHVLLDHPHRKDVEDWSWRETRESERVADRMMPWLLWNSGYDPHAAARWMKAWGPKHSGGLLRKRTHDGWDERLQMIEEEIAILEAQIAQHDWTRGEADWSARFAQP